MDLNWIQYSEFLFLAFLINKIGLSPSELVKNLEVKKDRGGRILVDNHLRVKDNVYAVGDCAVTEVSK